MVRRRVKGRSNNRFPFWALKSLQLVTAAMKLEDDCFLAEKWWKTEQCVENQRHYPANKGLYGQGYSLPSGHMWLSELDSEEGRMPKNWCFWTVCWRRFLKVPWRARRSNQPILREINPEYSLEGLVLKLKLQYFGHLMQATHGKSSWCWQRLRAEEKEGFRGWDGWMASLIQWAWTWANSRRWWGIGRPGMLQSTSRKESDMTEQQQHMICMCNRN